MNDRIHDRRAELPAIQAAGTVVAIVRDPYSDLGENITVLRATRDDPMAFMLARAFIDLAQFAAGREWQRLDEQAGRGALKSIDPTQEPVDGQGPHPAPFTDRQHAAYNELRVVTSVLGYEGNGLVRDILGERVQLGAAADRRGKSKKYIGQRFRECLETMAKMWGYA